MRTFSTHCLHRIPTSPLVPDRLTERCAAASRAARHAQHNAMADFDLGGIFFTDQSANNGAGERLAGEGDSDYLPAKAQLKYREFLRDFRREEEYIYRSLLRSAIGLKQAPSLSPPPPPSYLLRRLRPPPSRTDPVPGLCSLALVCALPVAPLRDRRRRLSHDKA